jgi:hypothetical protein
MISMDKATIEARRAEERLPPRGPLLSARLYLTVVVVRDAIQRIPNCHVALLPGREREGTKIPAVSSNHS